MAATTCTRSVAVAPALDQSFVCSLMHCRSFLSLPQAVSPPIVARKGTTLDLAIFFWLARGETQCSVSDSCQDQAMGQRDSIVARFAETKLALKRQTSSHHSVSAVWVDLGWGPA